MRSALLTGVSFALTALVVSNAYFQRQQFYPSVVYITKSNSSMAVIYIQALVFVLLFGKIMSKVFFGRLRAAEFEHLMERSWYAVTETCLAFTVFKDDFSPKFVALFSLLLFLKSFHWLAEDRVDFMERSPSISILFHIRLISLSLLLSALDLYFISHAYHSTLTRGASVQLVFGFEYAILLTIIINTVVKYVLHCIDLHSEHPWEGKAVCMLYSELVIGFVKVLFYILFIVIMVRIYTLPLFAVRPMYLTLRNFKKAFNDVIMSRRAIHNMNTWYPDATSEEIAATDNVCIICREEMLAPSTKKLPCNHIFHKTCLRSWFQRQQTCPTCRLDVLRAPLPNQAQLQQPQQPQALRQNQRPAQGAQLPPQQPQAPPPFPPPFDPAVFAQIFNQARLPPAQPQPTATTLSTTTANASSSATATTTTTAANGAAVPPSSPPVLPSFPLPPFALPPLPFTVPPPMPPPNFSGMTKQELSELEGTERSNVEARIKCLRNIQVLLDAAMLEMQQYTSVVARLNTTTATCSTSGVSSSSTAHKATAAVSPTVTSSTALPASGDDAAASKVDKNERKPIPGEETGAKPKILKAASDEDKEKEEIVNKMDDNLDEVRKRRLEKFEDNGTSSDK